MPQTEQLSAALPPQQVAIAVKLVLDHLDELDHGDIPLPDGRSLPVTSVPEVRSWLDGLRARCRAGERL